MRRFSCGSFLCLLSLIALFASPPASPSVNRKDSPRGNYGETTSDHFLAPTAIIVSDANGPLLQITSVGKCATSGLACVFERSPGVDTPSNSCLDNPTLTPNFIYFYIIRFLRTPTGQTKLSIPGQFEDPVYLQQLQAVTPGAVDVCAGILTDDQTNIAGCTVPGSTAATRQACAAPFFDDVDSTVDKTGAVLILNPGLQANDTIELHVDSYVPPACLSAPNANNPDTSRCPANSFMTVSQNGTALNAATPLQVIGPVLSLSVDPTTGNSISPFGTIVTQLNVNPASVTPPQTSPLLISITSITTANPSFIIGPNSKILWNGQPLTTTFSTPSGVPTVSSNVSASLLPSGGQSTIAVTNGGAISDPFAFQLLASDPQNIAVPATLVQGSGPVAFSVTGSGFLPNSIVQWNTFNAPGADCSTGDNRPTQFVSSTKLVATIFPDDLNNTGSTPIISVLAQPGTDSCAVNGITQLTNISFAVAATALSITGGSAPAFSATGISFPNETIGVSSSAQTVTLSNGFSAANSLTIKSFALAGADPAEYAIDPSTTTCTANESLAAGKSCVFGMKFTPAHAGARQAALQIANNSSNATLSVSLTGTGASPVPTLNNIIPNNAKAGSSFTLTLTGTGFTADTTVNFGTSPPLGPTSFTSTQLMVTVPASDVAVGGIFGVSVNNPAPGGGTSTPAINFTVIKRRSHLFVVHDFSNPGDDHAGASGSSSSTSAIARPSGNPSHGADLSLTIQ